MTIRVTNKTDLLMSTLKTFYRDPENLDKLLRIVTGKSRISLRLIDWFITNYAKTKTVIYPVEEKGHVTGETRTVQFIVHQAYKSALKAFSKKAFDPFCRGPNITFYYDTDKYIVTTPGQLNLMKWLITYGVLEYIENHLTEIEADMTVSTKTSRKAAEAEVAEDKQVSTSGSSSQPESSNKRRALCPLSVSATRTVTKHHVKLTVSFN